MIVERAGNHKEAENAELIRGTSMRSAAEVRSILAARTGFPAMRDLRQLGCPDRIFEHLLEDRARRMGFGQEYRTVPAPAPVEDTDLQAKYLTAF